MTPVWHPSPNWGDRRDGLTPALIVIHYTAMTSAGAALARLCDPVSEVSAHYLIGNNGTVWKMVDEAKRAWHAGVGEWRGQGDINSRSIGIELDNTGAHPFAEPQMAALEALMGGIMARWAIPADGVIGHSDMAPGRKGDPGPRFDWARLARQGLAHVPQPGHRAPPDPGRFRTLAQAYGFTAEADDATLLHAVRLRLCPWRRGPLGPADMAMVHTGVT